MAKRKPIGRKLKEAAIENSRGFCPFCGLGSNADVPSSIKEGVFETHHIVPVSRAIGDNCLDSLKITSNANNLLMVCPTCHNAIHYVKRRFGKDSPDAILANLQSIFTLVQSRMIVLAACASIDTIENTMRIVRDQINWVEKNQGGW